MYYFNWHLYYQNHIYNQTRIFLKNSLYRENPNEIQVHLSEHIGDLVMMQINELSEVYCSDGIFICGVSVEVVIHFGLILNRSR